MPREKELFEHLWSLPTDTRLAMLICSVVEHDPGAAAAIRNIIRVAVKMTRGLSVEQRYQLAEKFRDAADTIERQDAARVEIG